MKKLKVIISGGGTGGHIFPALSIAQSIKDISPDTEILFVGAEGKMEMEKVPAAGFPIKGLPVAGLQRKLTVKNLELPFKVLRSVKMASKIIREFKPDVAVGVGGYASAPMLWSAQRHGIPTLIQEQNSYAGLTNRILGRKAKRICTAYEGMEKFFPKERIILTGNPIRKEICRPTEQQKKEGYEYFSLDPSRKTIFVVGGSLGSRTLNEAMKKWVIERESGATCQIIWQSGKYYKSGVDAFLKEHPSDKVRNYDFIKRMDLAFAVADVIISRAGAGTISELCVEGKATIFVPSPNVTEDHQTHNAMALVEKDAALMVKDCEAAEKLMATAEELVADQLKISELEKNILKLARKDAGERIAKEVISLKYNNYYFLGIGGIGMSAIARYFNHAGYRVSGYDRTPSPLTARLEEEGIEIHYEDRIDSIPKDVEKTFVIYTPAIPEDFGEYVYIKEKGYPICKRSRALGEIARSQKCLAVAGTHGKTTTSTLLAHILTSCGEGCNAFLGGISKNYDTNLLLSKNNVLVAEADEFDRSFLQLFPDIAVITAADADHLDIYNDHAHVVEAFGEFSSQIKESGALVLKYGVDIPLEKVKARIYRYSYNTPCDFYASDIVPVEGGRFDFTINTPSGRIEHCSVGVPGWVNVENAVAASAIASLHGVSEEGIRNALSSFSGVKRRFDIHVNGPKHAYIDDYAHHPNELKAAISSMRNIFPGRKICGIFQPHLYTRTRDFADEFAEALSGLDSLIMLPIYPARELPIEGVKSEMILDKVTISDKVLVEKDKLMETIKSRDTDVLGTFGAGDVDRFIPEIEEYVKGL